MKKTTIEEIRAGKRKMRKIGKLMSRKLGFTTKQTTQKIAENHVRAQFIAAWILTIIAKMGDHFHHDFQTCLQVDPCKYMGVI